MGEFIFLEPGVLSDGEISLELLFRLPADEKKGYVPTYVFAICKAGSCFRMGQISLRIGHNENTYFGGNIGYGVEEAHRGHRYAMKACRLLLPFAKLNGMNRLLITCNPDNAASRRTLELLPARLLSIASLPEHNEMYLEGEREKCIFEVLL